MKHKAQECLNELCNHAMDCREECDWEDNWYLEYFDMEEGDLKELRNPIQDLINCQLTVEEIDKIIIGLAFLPSRFFTVEQEQVLLDKIIKQKEMWVSENE